METKLLYILCIFFLPWCCLTCAFNVASDNIEKTTVNSLLLSISVHSNCCVADVLQHMVFAITAVRTVSTVGQ